MPLPGGYGQGSSTLKAWIEKNLEADTRKGGKKSASLHMPANTFPTDGNNYYLDQGKWLAINPESHKSASTTGAFPFPAGKYHVTL